MSEQVKKVNALVEVFGTIPLTIFSDCLTGIHSAVGVRKIESADTCLFEKLNMIVDIVSFDVTDDSSFCLMVTGSFDKDPVSVVDELTFLLHRYVTRCLV